jgi:hypothetical protein
MNMFDISLRRNRGSESDSRLTRHSSLDLGTAKRNFAPEVSLFDNLTRSVAGTTSRRGALRVAP